MANEKEMKHTEAQSMKANLTRAVPTNGATPEQGWFLVWEDGEIHPGWGYARLSDLKNEAPGLITGRIATWDDLKRQGLRYVRCTITPTARSKAS